MGNRDRRPPTPAGMTRDPFYVSLWIGALVLAGNPNYDPFPEELHELAERYFSRFRPRARA